MVGRRRWWHLSRPAQPCAVWFPEFETVPGAGGLWSTLPGDLARPMELAQVQASAARVGHLWVPRGTLEAIRDGEEVRERTDTYRVSCVMHFGVCPPFDLWPCDDGDDA